MKETLNNVSDVVQDNLEKILKVVDSSLQLKTGLLIYSKETKI